MHGVNSAARLTSADVKAAWAASTGRPARLCLLAAMHAAPSCAAFAFFFVLIPRRLAFMRPSSLMPGQSCSVSAVSWRHNCKGGAGWEAGSICEGGWP